MSQYLNVSGVVLGMVSNTMEDLCSLRLLVREGYLEL